MFIPPIRSRDVEKDNHHNNLSYCEPVHIRIRFFRGYFENIQYSNAFWDQKLCLHPPNVYHAIVIDFRQNIIYYVVFKHALLLYCCRRHVRGSVVNTEYITTLYISRRHNLNRPLGDASGNWNRITRDHSLQSALRHYIYIYDMY